MGDHAAHDVFLHIVQHRRDLFRRAGIDLQKMLHGIGVDGGDMFVPAQLVRIPHRRVKARRRVIADGLFHLWRRLEEAYFPLLLAAGVDDLSLKFHDTLNLLVPKENGLQDHVLWQLVGARLHHHHCVIGTGDGEVQI